MRHVLDWEDGGSNPGYDLILLTGKRAKRSRERRDENWTRLNSFDSLCVCIRVEVRVGTKERRKKEFESPTSSGKNTKWRHLQCLSRNINTCN